PFVEKSKALRYLWLFLALPCLTLIILALPNFHFPFIGDDFDFLYRALRFRLSDLLPNAQSLYYRPLSREVYFGILTLLGQSPVLGHLLNAAALFGAVILLFLIVKTLAGERAAFFSTLLFSGMGALPTLVGWVCGIQDILAIVFVLGAILAEL